jgi:protease-4
MPLKKAYEIAEGRVYSGIEAKQIGLIDEFGGLEEAIRYAAKKAGISNYEIKSFPEVTEGFAAVLEELSASAKMAWKGPEVWMVERVQTLFSTPVQTRMPMDITIE